jgi:hypothetical protein
MFDELERRLAIKKKEEENELLEIFILIEENTMQTKVQALKRYSNLYNIKDSIKANDLMKKDYATFLKT